MDLFAFELFPKYNYSSDALKALLYLSLPIRRSTFRIKLQYAHCYYDYVIINVNQLNLIIKPNEIYCNILFKQLSHAVPDNELNVWHLRQVK